jgi:hypothetical protein
MMPARASRILLIVALGAFAFSATSCLPQPRAAVSMKVVRHKKTPADASVTIDEEYIGPLGWVAARGVRLPLGEHRITVERDGYFPYDAIVVANDRTVLLDVTLVPIPD